MTGGFKESPLRVNADLRLLDTWNEDAIKARARKLAIVALDVWPAPAMPAEILATYKSEVVVQKDYSMKDHPYLSSPNLRPLFEMFRKEVLALDPCITEEFLKLYVAYKAETNFVDAVPQAKQLKLYLNMRFVDISCHIPLGSMVFC